MKNTDHILKVSGFKNKSEKILKMETFCLDDLMDEMYIFVKTELQKKGKANVGVEILKYSSLQKCWVHTDRVRLKQIFQNLLDNAVIQTDRGYIFFGYHTTATNIISFFVDDTGIGMYNDYKLGLSIAEGLVQQMGGEMEVRPADDAGVSVHFNIVCQPCEIFEN